MADQIIKQFGKYRLIRLLGLGAFTDIHLGEHVTSKKQVAVKVFKQSLTSSEEEAHFLKTVRPLAELNHPNLVKILDFGVQDGTPFLIMTYASNGDLLQRHPKGTVVPFATVLNYVKQVAAALQYIHDKGFIHRGIRPGNIMLGSNNEVLLSDCSFVLESRGAHQSQANVADETIASIEYMAPEQLQGRPSQASDQYALGVLVYELLTGSTLFDDVRGTTEKIYQILQVDPQPLREKNPSIPASIEEVVMKAIVKDRRQRFESVQAFAEALEIASLPINPKRQNLEGKQFGNYRLISIIGQGGFANVYLAEHIHLKRKAAIKILDKKLTNADEVKFLNEARMIANLRHPNIIGILNYGVEDNMPFLVMDYAPNGTLRQLYPKGTVLSPISVLQHVKEAAEALHYAHYQGLIHRDVKPENMLLGRKNEVLLSDFGIAIAAHGKNEQGRQEIIGTLPYMAPEQIQGNPHRASDQYSLAIAIYEWLCGTCPFNGTPREITIGHLGITPKPLREHTPTLSSAIEEVVLRALAKDPLERYPTIQDFANAFEKACQYERPLTVKQRLVLPPQSQIPIDPVPSKQSLGLPQYPSKRELPPTKSLTEAPFLPSEATEIQPPGTLIYTHSNHHGRVNSVVWSPDVKYIASAGMDRIVQVWNPNSTLNHRGHMAEIRTVAWASNGKYIASAGMDRTVQVIDATSGKAISSYRNHAGSIFAIAWSSDGRFIASASDDETVQIWDAMNGQHILTYNHSGQVNAVAWSPNGKYLASASVGNIQVWEATRGSKRCSYRKHSGEVKAVAWSPDGTQIASGGADKTVQIWNAKSGQTAFNYSGHSGWMSFVGGGCVNAVAWLPRGNRSLYIVSASDDKTVQIWDASDGRKIHTYRGHTSGVNAIALSPDGKHIASASNDGTVQVWVAP